MSEDDIKSVFENCPTLKDTVWKSKNYVNVTNAADNELNLNITII